MKSNMKKQQQPSLPVIVGRIQYHAKNVILVECNGPANHGGALVYPTAAQASGWSRDTLIANAASACAQAMGWVYFFGDDEGFQKMADIGTCLGLEAFDIEIICNDRVFVARPKAN